MSRIPRILLTAPRSGTGKTMITCGILQALKNREFRVAAFKCGPDYIDPMFHREVIGLDSYNLDTFLCGREGVRHLLYKNGSKCDIAVIEGVMGYYDGLAGTSVESSAYDVADTTETPAVLILDCKGISVSIVPLIQGFLQYRTDSRIAGVILNRLSPMMYGRMKETIERETSVKVYGYVPVIEDCMLESRYLGLKMPQEIESFQLKLKNLGEILEQTLDLDGLVKLARTAPDLPDTSTSYLKKSYDGLRIGLAKDEAFCFMYQDNLDILEDRGVKLMPFSPIRDRHLPDRLDGLLFYGGYPELCAKDLCQNQSIRLEIRQALEEGLPCMAECGGFMYLQESITAEDGKSYEMVGALKGKSFYTSSLKRFGYVTLSQGTAFGKKIDALPAHEFHYYDSTQCGQEFVAKKPLSERSWKCMVSTETILAGYPHIHYYGNLKVVEAFLDQCSRKEERK